MPSKDTKSTEAANSGGPAVLAFTPAETCMVMAIFKNSTASGKPTPNWNAVAEDMSSTSVESMKVRFGQISRKYGWFTGVASPSIPAVSRPKKTPVSKKRARTAEYGDDAIEDTPTSKKKRTTGPEKATKKEATIDVAVKDEVEDVFGNFNDHIDRTMTDGVA
ncbi:uncharacterized protein BCR38DRAFT_481432 [Pseudomassariella vexata]|uniref:Myb-like domain-containing protein n=1 Tax=Pseudomassariella vexata TaxID=1141098 RepID=A0A1Y2EG58_9PEZI|nr:uncharacterized protein BCR38DRAFT_481432 [Pseudomassariella vexata]ORY70294.1 hypothetical protein BCR38DRAFT_481432 [Pseudomassariella vexata]